MIRINIQTLEVGRESIPDNLKGLSYFTLNNIQTELNPVPDDLINIEYWEEDNQSTIYDSETQKLGVEILTPDVNNKTVVVTHVIVELSAQEIADNIYRVKTRRIFELDIKAKEISTEDLTVGGVTFTTDNQSIADITTTLSIMGRSPAEIIDFKSVNGWDVANKISLEAMQDAVFLKRKSVNANHKLHDDAINLLTSVQSIIDYDINIGW